MSILHRVSRLDAHKRLLISLGMAGLTAGVLSRSVDPATLIMAVWLVYTVVSLSLIWTTILTAHPRNLSALFKAQDMSRMLSFLFVILAAFASLGAIVVLFKLGSGINKSLYVVLSGLVVVSSWLLVHTVFTLRYAHLYYEKQHGHGKTDEQDLARGLDFPGDNAPDYLDFAYFSFIIGMTSQVSDVAVKSKTMRRLALVHGVLAFFFNTSIIAISINTLLTVLQR